MSKVSPLLLIAACWVATGCQGGASPGEAPTAAQRGVAQHFAQAIVHGNALAAVALLGDGNHSDLTWLVARAAHSWKSLQGTIRLPGEHSGRRWIFGFAGTHTHKDGRFERVRGKILVLVAPSKRPGVVYFAVRTDFVRYSTHHDSVLMPSNR